MTESKLKEVESKFGLKFVEDCENVYRVVNNDVIVDIGAVGYTIDNCIILSDYKNRVRKKLKSGYSAYITNIYYIFIGKHFSKTPNQYSSELYKKGIIAALSSYNSEDDFKESIDTLFLKEELED